MRIDALRDVMPDGLPADPEDLLTSDDREQLWFDLNRLAKSRRDAEITTRDLPLGDAMPDAQEES